MVHRQEITMSAHGYTVIDVETTGLSSTTHDRVLEVAVVNVSDDGMI